MTSPENGIIHKHEEKSDDNIATICASNQKPLALSLAKQQCTWSTNDDLGLNDDNDGFRTPTSLDHRIRVMKQCPPPPRKISVSSRKRKRSSPKAKHVCISSFFCLLLSFSDLYWVELRKDVDFNLVCLFNFCVLFDFGVHFADGEVTWPIA